MSIDFGKKAGTSAWEVFGRALRKLSSGLRLGLLAVSPWLPFFGFCSFGAVH